MAQAEFTITRVNFYNEDSFWGAGTANFLEPRESCSVSGLIPLMEVGKTYQAEGEWSTHPKYGLQFHVGKDQVAQEKLPVTEEGLYAYLSSGIISGIGPSYAQKILDQFGALTPDIIENHPEQLETVPGIGQKRRERIHESWMSSKAIQSLAQLLAPYHVTANKILKIYGQFGDKAVAIIQKNPYRLIEIAGIGFKIADALALKMGVQKDSPYRIEAGTFFCLEQQEQKGNVCANQQGLLWDCHKLLDLPEDKIMPIWTAMEQPTERRGAKLIAERKEIYLRSLYQAEQGAAEQLARLAQTRRSPSTVTPEEIERYERMETESHPIKLDGSPQSVFSYAPEQKMAIQKAVNASVMILTGGPGTGKTTVIKGILQAMESRRRLVKLAAPTGRAAKRMEESTGHQAQTIHRLLKWKDGQFTQNASNPLSGDVLIVDESSMIDIRLLNALVQAVPDSMQLLFVGDVDQLPSVGAGSVLKDLIDCGVFPVVRLKIVQRQGKRSSIPQNARYIQKGMMPEYHSDFHFAKLPILGASGIPEDQKLAAMVHATCLATFDDLTRHGVNPDNIQILAPMHKGLAGTTLLNVGIKHYFQQTRDHSYLDFFYVPKTCQLTEKVKKKPARWPVTFDVGDRVMQNRNNYRLDVYNGDIGTVVEPQPEDEEDVAPDDVWVAFPSGKAQQPKVVRYNKVDQTDLLPAYAITIHKSQGSEFPIVILPILRAQTIMLQRNLIYTAVTRAKKEVILVGEEEALLRAVQNDEVQYRRGHLQDRILQELDHPSWQSQITWSSVPVSRGKIYLQ